MNQFIQRIANYIANEILIKGLANSRTFQRVALRTHDTIQGFKKEGAESINSRLDSVHKAAQSAMHDSFSKPNFSGSQAARPPEPPLTGVAGFVSAFAKEVRKDIGFK